MPQDRRKHNRRPNRQPGASKKVHEPRLQFVANNSVNIPAPKEKELTTGFIEWGKSNTYPLYLNELRYNNAIHGGIIEHKINYITAGGYEVEGPEAEAAKIFLANGTAYQDFNDVYHENTTDKVVFNAMAIRCVWKRNGKTISFFESVNIDKIRVRVVNDRVVMYAVSDDWAAKTQSKEATNYREIPPYDANNKKGEFLLYFSKPTRRTGKDDLAVYPKPEYMGAIKAINTDNRIDTYHLNEIANGFKTGTIISMNDGKIENKDEERRLAERIQESATAEDAAGGTVVVFTDGKERAPTIVNMNGNDLDKRYLQLEGATQQKTLTAHSITTPGLFGIKTSGQLGGQDELEAGFHIFKNTYIKSAHEFMEAAYNYILKLAGINASILLKLPPPLFAVEEGEEDSQGVLTALNSMSPLVATKILETMTINEVRALASLEGVEGGDEKRNADPAAMSKEEDPILEALSKVGVKKKYVRVIEGVDLPNEFTRSELERREKLLLRRAKFVEELTENEASVLDAIINGDKVEEVEIEGLTQDDIDEAVEGLKEKGFLTDKGNTTDAGEEAIDAVEFEILYEYAKRANAPALRPGGTSRPFCIQLMEMDLLYTREEIEQIGAAVGRQVWEYRGGWYHNPETGQNTPFCRHVWRQVVVQVS